MAKVVLASTPKPVSNAAIWAIETEWPRGKVHKNVSVSGQNK